MDYGADHERPIQADGRSQMNEQQLAAMKQALEALKECRCDPRLKYEHPFYDKVITDLEQAIAQDALYKMAEDAVTIGLSYNDWPKIGCVNHDCDQCKAVQEPVTHQNWCASLTQLLLSHPPQPAPCNCKQPAQPAPVQEPVAQSLKDAVFTVIEGFNIPHDVRKILESAYYNAPPAAQKQWVGLTDEEIQTAWDEVMDGAVFTRREVYEAIETKLKEKNHA
jgi:hypothetical protein